MNAVVCSPKRVLLFALALWIGFVAFGSWYPFKFQNESLQDALVYWWKSVGQYKPKTDIVVNFLVGVPTGFLSYAWLISSGGPGATWFGIARRAAIYSGLISMVVSSFVEIAQFYFVGRDCSLWDTIFQIVGSLAGMVVAIVKLLDPSKISTWFMGNWSRLDFAERMTGIIFFLFLVYQVWPLIPSLSPSELKDKLKVVMGSLITEKKIDLATIGRFCFRLQSLVFLFPSLCGGFFLVRAIFKRPGLSAIARCILAAFFLIAIESSKLIIDSRMPSFETIFICSIGATVGGVVGCLGWAENHGSA